MEIYRQFISIYGKFVTSPTASFSRVDINTPIFLQLKSKIRPIFVNFEQKSSVFETIITTLAEIVQLTKELRLGSPEIILDLVYGTETMTKKDLKVLKTIW